MRPRRAQLHSPRQSPPLRHTPPAAPPHPTHHPILSAPRAAQAAKKRGIVDYASPLLLKGTHDKVVITLLKEAEGPPPAHG